MFNSLTIYNADTSRVAKFKRYGVLINIVQLVVTTPYVKWSPYYLTPPSSIPDASSCALVAYQPVVRWDTPRLDSEVSGSEICSIFEEAGDAVGKSTRTDDPQLKHSEPIKAEVKSPSFSTHSNSVRGPVAKSAKSNTTRQRLPSHTKPISKTTISPLSGPATKDVNPTTRSKPSRRFISGSSMDASKLGLLQAGGIALNTSRQKPKQTGVLMNKENRITRSTQPTKTDLDKATTGRKAGDVGTKKSKKMAHTIPDGTLASVTPKVAFIGSAFRKRSHVAVTITKWQPGSLTFNPGQPLLSTSK